MQSVGAFVRSNLPGSLFGQKNPNEDTCLLIPSNINTVSNNNPYYSRFNDDDDDETQNTYQNTAYEQSKDSDDNRFSYDAKLNHNRINAWQASWNISNAIQVNYHCKFRPLINGSDL